MESAPIIIAVITLLAIVVGIAAFRRADTGQSSAARDRILEVLSKRGAYSKSSTFMHLSRGFGIDPETQTLAIIDLPTVTYYPPEELLRWQMYRQTSAPPLERAERPTKADVTGVPERPHPANGFITFWLGTRDDPTEVTFDMGPPKNAEIWSRRLEKTFPGQKKKP